MGFSGISWTFLKATPRTLWALRRGRNSKYAKPPDADTDRGLCADSAGAAGDGNDSGGVSNEDEDNEDDGGGCDDDYDFDHGHDADDGDDDCKGFATCFSNGTDPIPLMGFGPQLICIRWLEELQCLLPFWAIAPN